MMSTISAWEDEDVGSTLRASPFADIGSGHKHLAGVIPKDFTAQLLAKNPSALEYLNNDPSEDVLIRAAQANGEVLAHVKHPTHNLVNAVLEKNPEAFQWVASPSKEQQQIALTAGQLDGAINVALLAKYSAKFSHDVLDKLRPGLSFIMGLIEGSSEKSREETLNHYLGSQSSFGYSGYTGIKL